MSDLIDNSQVITGTMDNSPKTVSSNQNVESDTQHTPQAQDLEFSRSNIEKLSNNIYISDSDDKLEMFCYVNCCDTDSDIIKESRGVVFNGNDIVMKAFPYTIEVSHTDTAAISANITNFSEWNFYESHEGALIRMFNFNGKWYVSTHRKLNAFRSKWSSRESFGASFKNALWSQEDNNPNFAVRLPEEGDNILDRFQSTLDISKQYMFLIRNTIDNRIVCDAPLLPTLYHVGTFVEGGKLSMTEDIGIQYPKKLNFNSITELQDFVDFSNYKNIQGVICFHSSNKQVKILNKDYLDLFKARGNEPSIKFRYLQVRTNIKYVDMLYHLYPEMKPIFEEYENTIGDISRSIYRAYVLRFIKKKYVTVPKEEFAVIRECHSWHLSDRTTNKVSLNIVTQYINQQSPTNINHMIRRFRLEKIRLKDAVKNSSPKKTPSKNILTSKITISPLLLSSKITTLLPHLTIKDKMP